MTFRRFQPADLPQCLLLHTLNEPGRFPELERPYEMCLREQRSYTLVAEHEGRIVASGSMQYVLRKNIATLSFGLVHPEFQGKGIGTALVLARLALLKPSQPYYRVLIFSVVRSIGFYRRFGFVRFRPWKDKHGHEHPSGAVEFTSRDIRRCRKLLVAHGISFPPDEDLVPLIERPDASDQPPEDKIGG